MKKLFLLILVLSISIPLFTHAEEVDEGLYSIEGHDTVSGNSVSFLVHIVDGTSVKVKTQVPTDLSIYASNKTIVIENKPSNINSETSFTISGLQPLTKYYKYYDSYSNLEEVTTDISGVLTYDQDISDFHFVSIQIKKSTKFIALTPSGWDCRSIGIWDNTTKTCTLTQDVFETIQISGSEITLDGNGYSVLGAGSGAGVYIFGYSNVVVKNLTVKGFFFGMQAVKASQNNFSNNILEGNVQGGILLSSSQNIVLHNNKFVNDHLHVSGNTVAQYSHVVDVSNTINGKPIIYLVGAHDEEYHQVLANTFYCISCNNIVFEGSVFDDEDARVVLYDTTNTTIKNLQMQGDDSFIHLENSMSNIIEANTLHRTFNQTITLYFSSNNKIINNTVSGSESIAIFQSSNNNSIEDNNITGTSSGIYVAGGNNNIIKSNESSQGFNGINFNVNSAGNVVYNNTFRNNKNGINFSYRSNGSNLIYNNNFIDNSTPLNNGGTLQYKFNEPLPVGGNYWSQFDESIEGCDDLNNDNICDAPFNLRDGGNNIDNFPWKIPDGWIEGVCINDCFSNVLFLPGLKASRLYTPRSSGGEDQLWEPNANSDVEDLYLNTNGLSINQNIYTRDIIQETNSPISAGFAGQNIYKSFSDTMDQLVEDEKISQWKSYAYDWRESVDDIVNNGTKYENETVLLVDTLQSLVDSSKNGKVTIVAHSNGGLLAKALLKKLQDDKNTGRNNLIDRIDVLILVAVPEIGTATTVPAILHGYDQQILDGWLIDETRARELGRNMLGAYGLLPSREYLNRVSASPVTFVDNVTPSNITTKLVQTFGSAIDSYEEYKSFLFGADGRVDPFVGQTNLPINLSESLFIQAESLHDDIDAWVPPENLRVIEVAGWGLDTVASMEYYPKRQSCPPGAATCPPYALDQKPRFTADGDGTVVVPSAHYMSFLGNAEKYWVNLFEYNEDNVDIFGKQHKNILEIDSLNNLIQLAIQGKDITLDSILKNSEPADDSDRLRLAIHSPVTLDAYDAEGNHTGKICPQDSEFCYVEENILNSSYLEFGEGKYVNLPEDEMHKVKLQGTGIGTFTYESEKVSPDGTSTISHFINIPVTTQTQAEITLDSITQEPKLALDVTGDGLADFTLIPSDTFDPITYLQILKTTINSLELPHGQKIAFGNRVDNIIKSIEKGKIDQAKLKADKFKIVFENTLEKKDPKKPKSQKLSKTDAQLLLDMLNKLLDNIN